MKRTSLIALAVAGIVSGTNAAANMESALFAAGKNDLYAKATLGYMNKEISNNDETIKGITNSTLEMGYGITDALSVRGMIKYTSNPDEARKGLTIGKIGVNYRALSMKNPVTLDFFSDMHLGGAIKSKAQFDVAGSLPAPDVNKHYSNYSHGRYGVATGFQIGKEIGKWQAAARAEVKYTIAGEHSKFMYDVNVPPLVDTGYARARLGDAWDYELALKASYQATSKWLLNGSIAWKYFDSTDIEKIKVYSGTPALQNTLENTFGGMLLGSQKDSYQEWIYTIGANYTLNEQTQLGFFAEYTKDNADNNKISNKETKYKYELGIRINILF